MKFETKPEDIDVAFFVLLDEYMELYGVDSVVLDIDEDRVMKLTKTPDNEFLVEVYSSDDEEVMGYDEDMDDCGECCNCDQCDCEP